MLFYKTIDIAEHERALVYRRSQLREVLTPGRHKFSTLFEEVEVVKYDVTEQIFSGATAERLLNFYADVLADFVQPYRIGDRAVGLLYRNGRLDRILVPGEFIALWKGVGDARIEIIDITDNFQLDDKLLAVMTKLSDLKKVFQLREAVHYVEVADEHKGMLMLNGKLERFLEPGNYGFWKYNRNISVQTLDMRLRVVEVGGQEILTKDRVSLRLNLTAAYRLLDAEAAALKLADYEGFIYRELQLRLREAVGTQNLDKLLEDKDSLNGVIAEAASAQLANYGIELNSVGIKDIILPGDMKEILNKVVEAGKEAEANVIRRREETQAMRALHNTAKLMENNQTLLRLKELESLERVVDRVDNLSVYGGLDGVMNQLVSLRDKSA